MPVDPQIAGLLSLIEVGTPMYEQDPAAARAGFRTLTVDMRAPETVVPVAAVEETTVAGAEGDLRARVYRPEGEGPFPTVVLFHGGGFVIGDLDTHDNMARTICAGADAVVVSVDYRLAPEHPFPAAPMDALAATLDVMARRAQLGGSDVVAVAGDSAGGNLSAVVAQQVPEVAAQLLLYPVTDVAGEFASREENGTGYFLDTPTMAWFMQQYLPEGVDLEDPRLSPLRGDLTQVSPAVVVTAGFDPLRDEGDAYAAALEAAGVRVVRRSYGDLIHGFMDMGAWSGSAKAAVDDAVAAFADLLRSVARD